MNLGQALEKGEANGDMDMSNFARDLDSQSEMSDMTEDVVEVSSTACSSDAPPLEDPESAAEPGCGEHEAQEDVPEVGTPMLTQPEEQEEQDLSQVVDQSLELEELNGSDCAGPMEEDGTHPTTAQGAQAEAAMAADPAAAPSPPSAASECPDASTPRTDASSAVPCSTENAACVTT